MTIETRYFRSDEKLGTVNTTTGDSRYIIPVEGQGYIGVMVYVDGVLISGAVPVAKAVIPAWISEVDGVWACPNQASAGIVKVDVYACNFDGSSPHFIVSFVTVDSIKLDAATWTVHYWCVREYVDPDFYITFFYGRSAYASRITNFQWSIPIVVSKAAVSNPIIFMVLLDCVPYVIKKRRKRRIVASVI